MTGWRSLVGRLSEGVACARLLAADPGALAVLMEIEPVLRRHVASVALLAEGWALGRAAEVGARPFHELHLAGLAPGSDLWLGARMDFARTRGILKACRRAGVRSLYVFDHWKNYASPFLDGQTGEAILPDIILLPDDEALRGFSSECGRTPALASLLPSARLVSFGHPALEAAADRIRHMADAHPRTHGRRTAVLFLDPSPPGGNYGYAVPDVIACLAGWIPRHRPGITVLVKPHPRQTPPLTRKDFASWTTADINFKLVDTAPEELMAQADEVWGMTSITLLTALAAGLPIISFQPGRNDAGRRESNIYLERHLAI